MKTMEEPALRQRRNLMAMSCLLLVFDFADISIAKVSILGTELVVGKPRVLIIFIWAVWAYALLRYYQFTQDCFIGNSLANEYRSRLVAIIAGWGDSLLRDVRSI